MHLRALHNESAINCKSIALTVNENFDQANIFNTVSQKYENAIQNPADKPTLHLTAGTINLNQMSDYD